MTEGKTETTVSIETLKLNNWPELDKEELKNYYQEIYSKKVKAFFFYFCIIKF